MSAIYRCMECSTLIDVSEKRARGGKKATCPKCFKRACVWVADDSPMYGVNEYAAQLGSDALARGAHRDVIGGEWDTGTNVVEFFKSVGLEQDHKFLDVGCGCLRAGIPMIKYISAANYFGIDCNASLKKGGELEAQKEGLDPSTLNYMVDARFGFREFGQEFDFAYAGSVFTHLPLNFIIRCLVYMSQVLRPDGVFYATYLDAMSDDWVEPTPRKVGVVEIEGHSYWDQDPFHQTFDQYEWMASQAGLRVSEVPHPKGMTFEKRQRLLRFEL